MLLSQPIEEKRHMAKASATKTSVTKANPAYEATVVDSTKLKRTKVWGETDKAVNWEGAFAVYGGNGTTASSTIVYEVEPGKRLGWHTDATEETQYIIAGQGKLYLEDGSVHLVGARQRVRAADADAPRPGNTGKETLRAVAFFAAAMFTQDFDQVMLPPKSHILGTPNRAG
jgi:quercetin dioxygenase-like cupin family protein